MASELDNLIERFISGEETSVEVASAIEVALDDAFPEDDHVQQTVEMLAMYRPGGGDFLFDTVHITRRLIETVAYLRVQ